MNAKTPVDLFDGEWHHLHRGTPFFRGGIFVVAAIGFLLTQLRDVLVEMFFQLDEQFFGPQMPLEYWGWILLAAIGLLLGTMLLFYLSWRMHTFRITDDVIEVRSGLIFRSHRKVRIDRIQGINIHRPIIPRLFSAAKLEISGAGAESSVALNYLSSDDANRVRRGLLRRVSGQGDVADVQLSSAPGATPLDRTVSEFLAPELDDLYRAESLVRIPIDRLILSVILSMGTILMLVVIAGIVFLTVFLRDYTWSPTLVFGLLPAAIGFGSYYINQVRKRLRYSIADTPHGVRIGYGLASLANDTLPQNRIHAIELRQPLLWRGVDWWAIEVNRATVGGPDGSANEVNTTILPVGTREDVMKVLTILLPDYDVTARADLLTAGMVGKGQDQGFHIASPRAFWYQPISWRRNGWNYDESFAFLRTGALTRRFVLVPFGRIQSVTLQQGLGARLMNFAAVHLNLVPGPVNYAIWNIDSLSALEFFERVREHTLRAVGQEAQQILESRRQFESVEQERG